MSIATGCYYVVSNPDISGIGVRLSFYIQTFIGILLVDRESDATAVWTFIATSFGLTVSAIVQDAQNQLSLYQALQVSNLVWLANFGSFLALASYSRGKTHHNRIPLEHHCVRLATMLQTCLSMALTFYMWITANTFGNQPGCDVVYVLFAINTPALGSGRIVGLTFTSLLTASYLFITALEMRIYLTHWRRSGGGGGGSSSTFSSNNNSDHERKNPPSRRTTVMTNSTMMTTTNIGAGTSSPPTPSQSRRPSLPLSVTFPDSPYTRRATNDTMMLGSQQQLSQATGSSHHRRRPRRRNWFAEFDPMLLGITICQVVVFGYFIVSSELLRVRNRSASQADGQWAFGQILALITIAPSLASLIRAFEEHGFRRTHRRRADRRRRKRTAGAY